MAKQTLLFTALPNGFSDDKKSLRLSVFVSPRLDPESAEPRPPLSSFGDFVNWPATLRRSTFVVHFGASSPVTIQGDDFVGVTRVDDRLAVADSDVWTRMFPGTTFVKGHEFRDLSKHAVLSYPAAEMDALVRNLYTRLAVSAQDQLPTVATILDDQKWSGLVDAVARHDQNDLFTNHKDGVRRPQEQFDAFKNGEFDGPLLRQRLARFQLFHTPAAAPKTARYENAKPHEARAHAKWLEYERAKMPDKAHVADEYDFHQIVAAMAQYPTLLRKLGLTIDLLVSKNALTPAANALLWVEVQLPEPTVGALAVTRAPDASPRTRTLLDASRFQAVPRKQPEPNDYRIADGLLTLDPNTFTLIQSDVDGAGHKIMNFARTLRLLKKNPPDNQDHQIDPVSQKPRKTGAPALRNAGLTLVHNQRASALKNSFNRQKAYNDAAEKLQAAKASTANPPPKLPNPPEQWAEDLVRGFRIDIWDDVSESWHSLCRRSANYTIYTIADGAIEIAVNEEEGTVRLAATTTPDPASNPDIIWLHETLVAWTGWSLCAPPPGRNVSHDHDTHVDTISADNEAEVAPGIPLKTKFTAMPRSLPRLRYGRAYWLRARAVDLAGNSLPFRQDDFGPESPKKNAVRYLRFEPVSAPALALVKTTPDLVEAPLEGESMECIAVRSFNDTPLLNTVPATQRARRFAVPPRTSAKEAELHGMLDRKGVVDPNTFTILTKKDASLEEEKIITAGPPPTSTGAKEAELQGVFDPKGVVDPTFTKDAPPEEGKIITGGPPPDNAPVETGYAALLDGDPLPYLPEPLANVVAARIFGHPDFPATKIIPIPLYDDAHAWPDALPFKIEIYEGNPGDTPVFDEESRTLFIPLPKAVRATLRLSMRASVATLKLLGVWDWLSPAHKASLKEMTHNGQHWMLTPWRNVELVHAVQRPLVSPDVLKHVVHRPSSATFALPQFLVACSIASTDRIDVRAKWNEPDADHPSTPPGVNPPRNRPRTDHAFSVKITDEKSYAGPAEYQVVEKPAGSIRLGGRFHDLIPEKVHEFHDTRYRRIEYWLTATTKFREFMPSAMVTKLVDGKPEPTEENISVTGQSVITWIKSSAPPPAPDVLYVVPTFGWVRSLDQPDKSSWRRGGGLRVYLNRPWNVTGYGEMLAVVLPSTDFNDDPNTDPKAQPLKNFVTQWGNDPIWLSPFVQGSSPKRKNFPLARTARDGEGKWLPKFAPPDEADQPPGPFKTSSLEHPELKIFTNQSRVDIAPHDVFYDEERQLWYCDIEVNWGAAYWPFIRLALARYQPVSLQGAHLSNIVLADFMPLVPDRWLNVTRTAELRTRQVTVFGHTFSDSSAHNEAHNAPLEELPGHVYRRPINVASSSVLEVWVERFDPALGEDFGWVHEPDAVVQQGVLLAPFPREHIGKVQRKQSETNRARELFSEREFAAIVDEKLIDHLFVSPVLWKGSVTLPKPPGGDTRFRLVIAEYEEYLVDDAKPYDPYPKKKDRRLVFVEHVALD